MTLPNRTDIETRYQQVRKQIKSFPSPEQASDELLREFAYLAHHRVRFLAAELPEWQHSEEPQA